jgi:DNA-binding transcriptional MerR regulator
MLGVSVRTLDRYQAAGLIQPCPVPLRPRLFREADVRALATGEKVPA